MYRSYLIPLSVAFLTISAAPAVAQFGPPRGDDRGRSDDRSRYGDRGGFGGRSGDSGRSDGSSRFGGFGGQPGGFGGPPGGFSGRPSFGGPPGGSGSDGRSDGRPSFSPERIYDFLDRDRDGRLSREEMERAPGPLRGMLERGGIRENASRDDFTRGFERAREEYRRDGEGGDSRRDGDGRDSAKANASKVYKPAPRERVTADLPEQYVAWDVDGDGQVGLYEWRQWGAGSTADFLGLDRNGDGFLTPHELLLPPQTPMAAASSAAPSSVPSAAAAPPADDRPQRAADTFAILDDDGSGKIEPGEWAASKKLRPLFEQAGLPLDRDMTRDEFVAGYLKVAPQ